MLNPRPVVQAALIEDGRYCLVVDDFLAEPHKMVAHAVAQREAFRAAPINCYPGIEQPLWAEFDQAMAAFFNAHLAPAFGAMQALGLNTRMSIVTLKPEELMPQQRICHRDARDRTGRGRGGVGAVFVRGRAWAAPASTGRAGIRWKSTTCCTRRAHGQRRLQPRDGRRRSTTTATSAILKSWERAREMESRHLLRRDHLPHRPDRRARTAERRSCQGRLTINAFIRYRTGSAVIPGLSLSSAT
jgi:hypothetical protein